MARRERLIVGLNKWLRQGGCKGKFSVNETADGILGLFATGPVSIGQPLLMVPSNLQMRSVREPMIWEALDSSRPRSKDSHGLDVSVGMLAHTLLVEFQKGDKSSYSPYIDALPTLKELSSAAWLWNREEVQQMLPPSCSAAALSLAERVEADHKALMSVSGSDLFSRRNTGGLKQLCGPEHSLWMRKRLEGRKERS